MLTRPLVLTTESARHPFRQKLPAHVLQVMPPVDTSPTDARSAKAAKQSAGDDQDWKLFVLSFAAFFTAFYSFIA